jgi:hypothetical protein
MTINKSEWERWTKEVEEKANVPRLTPKQALEQFEPRKPTLKERIFRFIERIFYP